MRIAWIGSPGTHGGVGGFCRQLLTGLLDGEDEVTVFGPTTPEIFEEALGQATAQRARLVSRPPDWEWDRWYSRNGLSVFISSMWARRRAHAELVKELVRLNREKPFDVVVQFSQTELFGLRKHLGELPPVLIFPCVHAAGELRWHRREKALARRSESLLKHLAVRLNLWYRARLQKQSVRAVHGVLGMSHRFNQLVAEDYGIDPRKQAVVHQPIDPPEDSVEDVTPTRPDDQVRLLFVGRIAVRKGVEALVDLSQRLDDLADQVEINVVGGPSFWSDYSGVLADLNPRVGNVLGSLPNAEVKRLMSDHDALLAPSRYEPGGIVVAESLSLGCPVIVTDEVGSAEPFSEPACVHFRAGDHDAFEAAVRRLVETPHAAREASRAEARAEAARRLAPTLTRDHLRRVLRLAADRDAIASADTPPEWDPNHSVSS